MGARILVVVGLLCGASAAPAGAQGNKEPASTAPVASPSAAAPDRVGFSSGDVLWCKVLHLRGKKLAIKSPLLGEQKLPWEKVTSLRVQGKHVVRLDDAREVTGTGLVLRAGRFSLQTAEGERAFAKARIKAINPRTELQYWSVKATLGWAGSYGNTRRQTLTGLASVVRDTGRTRLSLGYIGAYSELEKENDTKKHRGDGQLDWKITKRFYATPFVGMAEYDKFANIALRWRAGAGVGAIVLQDEDWGTARLEIGGSYTRALLRRAAPEQSRQTRGPSARFAARFELKLNSRVTFKGFFETYVGLDDIQNTTHHGEATLSFKLSVWSFDLGVIYDRNERPKRGTNGKIPKKDDAKLLAGLGVAF